MLILGERDGVGGGGAGNFTESKVTSIPEVSPPYAWLVYRKGAQQGLTKYVMMDVC